MHAETADPPEYHRQIRHTMERKNERIEGRKCLTLNTDACSSGLAVLQEGAHCISNLLRLRQSGHVATSLQDLNLRVR